MGHFKPPSHIKSGDDDTSFLEFFNDKIVFVAPAATTMCQAVHLERLRVKLAYNGTIDLLVT